MHRSCATAQGLLLLLRRLLRFETTQAYYLHGRRRSRIRLHHWDTIFIGHHLFMLGPSLDIADWNTRGLNDQARKDVVHAMIADTPCHIACLQETKLEFIDHQTAAYIGGNRLRSFAHRPAIGTRGGILLLWNDDYIDMTNVHIGVHLISADVLIRDCGTSFKITNVYGPSTDALKQEFLDEMVAAIPPLTQNG